MATYMGGGLTEAQCEGRWSRYLSKVVQGEGVQVDGAEGVQGVQHKQWTDEQVGTSST